VAIFKDPVSSLQETQDLSIRKTTRLMLLREIIDVLSGNLQKHLKKLTQVAEFFSVKACETYN
jgi:hypothetical protein